MIADGKVVKKRNNSDANVTLNITIMVSIIICVRSLARYREKKRRVSDRREYLWRDRRKRRVRTMLSWRCDRGHALSRHYDWCFRWVRTYVWFTIFKQVSFHFLYLVQEQRSALVFKMKKYLLHRAETRIIRISPRSKLLCYIHFSSILIHIHFVQDLAKTLVPLFSLILLLNFALNPKVKNTSRLKTTSQTTLI